MNPADAMKQAIAALGMKNQRFVISTGKAVNVEYTKCDVERMGLPTLTDVRLNAIDAAIENKVTIHPTEGSYVQVAMIEGTNESFIISSSEINMVEIAFADTTVEVTNDGVVIDKGENGGMVISPELVTQLAKLTKRVDGIIHAIKNAKPAAGSMDGGTVYQAQMVAFLNTLTNKEDFSNIENPKVTH